MRGLLPPQRGAAAVAHRHQPAGEALRIVQRTLPLKPLREQRIVPRLLRVDMADDPLRDADIVPALGKFALRRAAMQLKSLRPG